MTVTYFKGLGYEKAASFKLFSSLLLGQVGDVQIKILVWCALKQIQFEEGTVLVIHWVG